MIIFSLLRSLVLIFLRIFSIGHSKNFFHKKFYTQWRRVRIKKLLSIYNVKNKKILELGAATGATGKILSKYGANVTISDARAFLLEKIKSKNLTKILINNDEDNWSKVFKNNERFDLIVHWGLLYHLYNWKEDLKECLKLADYICLETIIKKVTERGGREDDPGEIVFEYGQDQSKNFIARIPSQESIEKYLKSQRCIFKRFDDKDLDVYLDYKHDYFYLTKYIIKFVNFFLKRKILIKNNKICAHNYSWDTNPPYRYSRRFWLIKSNNMKNKV